jgi:hypothetical protein
MPEAWTANSYVLGITGLGPGFISGYCRISAAVPTGVTQGDGIPPVTSQGDSATTLNVRVVN